VVAPGRVYRSAQLRGSHLIECLRSRGIRSVISLRGASRDPVLNEERGVCAQLGIAHADIAFSSVRLPPPAEVRRLLEAFDSLPPPILVHCWGGADRSGLASTLYLTIYEGVALGEAESRQLTWRYGHLRWKAHPMDDFFTLYRETANGQALREWITKAYPDLYATRSNNGKMPRQ